MIALLQRVSESSVAVEKQTIAAIGTGLMVLIGVQPEDNEAKAQRLLDRILSYRVFEDELGKMNRSLQDTQGGLLLVPQFTLAADTRKGNRPSFTTAAPPALARSVFEWMVKQAKAQHDEVASGIFAADMKVHLINDGPVTFWVEVP